MYFLSIQFTKIVITQFFWDLNIIHPLLIIKIDFTKISEALGGCKDVYSILEMGELK